MSTSLVLAEEPSGDPDTKSADVVFTLLRKANADALAGSRVNGNLKLTHLRSIRQFENDPPYACG